MLETCASIPVKVILHPSQTAVEYVSKRYLQMNGGQRLLAVIKVV